MKVKKIYTPAVFAVAVLITILYEFFAPRPLGKEYQFNPVWKINTLSQPVTQNDDKDKIYFRLGKTAGYFTDDGQITLYKQFEDKISISDSYYAPYDSDAVKTPFFNSKGEKAGEINAAGFPFFCGSLIFVFLPGGAAFVKCNSTGETVWQYEGTMPVTAFSAKENYCAAGFADGSIKVFETENGNCILSYAPGGSDFSVILGLDVSEDGKYIASVSGHEKQRFVLAQRELNQPKIIYHKYLKDGLINRTLVHFTKDSSQVVYNYKDTVGVYNLITQKENSIAVKDRINSIRETENQIFMLGNTNKNYTVYIMEKTNHYEGSFSFEAASAFIQTYNEELYVGKDNTISKIEITKE